MAAGARGMVSLEIAVLMSVVLVIATAVGWYLYTTFVASTVGQPRLGGGIGRVIYKQRLAEARVD
jgi:type IV pilus assembly protein PilA